MIPSIFFRRDDDFRRPSQYEAGTAGFLYFIFVRLLWLDKKIAGVVACLALCGLTVGANALAAGNPNSGNTLFNSASPYCMACHASPPEGGRLSAANNPAVIASAIATDQGGPGGMARYGSGQPQALSATQLNNLAAYFGWFVVPTTAAKAVSVNYNSSSNVIDLSGDITVGTPISIATPTGPAHGTINAAGVNSSGANVVTTVTYTPTAGYYGSDSFTYNVTNNAGTSVTRTVTITVNPPPAPVTSAKSAVVSYQTATGIDLTSSITGVTSGAVSVTAGPSHGTVTSVVGKTVNYTPVNGYYGSDSFSYNIAGPGGTSNTSVVSITVGLPPAPIAGAKSMGVGYNSVANVIDLSSSITWPSTSVAVTVAPAKGVINSVAGNVVTYTPNPLYFGTDSFSYTATGPGGGPSAPAVVTITVANPPPPTVADKTVTLPYNTAAAIDLASSVSGVSTGIAIASAPGHGTAVVSGYTVWFTPAAGYSGPDSFTYTATGPGGTSAPMTVNITVDTLAPTAGATTMAVLLNTPATLDLAPFITGSSISGVSIAANPAHGRVTVNGTRVTFTPANNYFGADAFSYVAYGNAGTSPPAVVSVTVAGRPDPTQDAAVTGMVRAQVETTRRFSRAQISNFQTRMESLHRRPLANGGASNAGSGAGADFAGRSGGAAYRPAASLSADPAAGLNPATAASPANPAAAVATLASAISAAGGNSSEAAALGKALAFAANGSRSASLHLSSDGSGMAAADGGINVWVGGGVRFGSRNPDSSTGHSFSTDGVSVGADYRVNDKLAVGAGVGYGRDTTEIGIDGTTSRGKSTTVAAYASYQPTENTYLDGVAGYGQLDYKTERFVAPVNDFARGNRSGDFVFASLTAGYEFQTEGLRLSPYGRLDLAQHWLHAATESGAGAYALTYGRQSIPSVQLAAGLRAESVHESRFGLVMPRMRIEFQHEFKGEDAAILSYADLAGGPVYTLPGNPQRRDSLVLGVGSDLVLGRGLTLSLDYQLQRSTGQENIQAVLLKLVKNLDGKNSGLLGSSAFTPASLGIKIDVSATFDDNINRASAAADVRQDRSIGVNLSKSLLVASGEKTRLFLNAFGGAERFKTYAALDNVYLGGDAEWQYRASGDYDSPIWSLFGSVKAMNFESDQRDGYRYSVGVNVRQALTDRISLFGALSRNRRYADSAVFDGSEYSARFNLDYAVTPFGTLYVGGEYRVGDIVSSGTHTLANINIARMFTPDSAFLRNGFYAYRFEGKTVIFTLGYNHALGNKDSFDMSWRRARSTPDAAPGLPGVGTPRYIVNQLSLMYLTSF